MRKIGIVLFALLFSVIGLSQTHSAGIAQATQVYHDGDAALEGVLLYDTTRSEPRALALVFHDWMGISSETIRRATMLAGLGYAVFCVDMYGQGVRPTNTTEARENAGKFYPNRSVTRNRARAAYDFARTLPQVDTHMTYALGYCFGGMVALELARSGAAVAGTVSFHGGLGTPNPGDAKNISGQVLVLHGADDPYVPAAEIVEFRAAMDTAVVRYQFIAFRGAVHSFTNPGAGNDNAKGAAYNAAADEESWEIMKSFFTTIAGERASVKAPIFGEYLPSPDKFATAEVMPKFVNKVLPKYPAGVKQDGREGIVWVKILVDRDGKVRDALIAKPSGLDASFDNAALEAAKQCTFSPATVHGNPIAIWVTFPFEFKLPGAK